MAASPRMHFCLPSRSSFIKVASSDLSSFQVSPSGIVHQEASSNLYSVRRLPQASSRHEASCTMNFSLPSRLVPQASSRQEASSTMHFSLPSTRVHQASSRQEASSTMHFSPPSTRVSQASSRRFPQASSRREPQASSRREPQASSRLKTTRESKTVRERSFLDNASNMLTNLLSEGKMGNMPVAEGAVSDLFGRPLFFALYDWFIQHGAVYKLAFGPKAFVVVSDPIVARHILRENAFGYDKGVLADILEPIMGKGLIPADLVTWKTRRRAIVPGFHASYLESMVQVFNDCTEQTMQKLEALTQAAERQGADNIEVEMESEYSNLALDIIGLSVFNYNFGSVTTESPVIQAVYGTLYEAEHRSTFYIPYWKFPPSRWLVPRQRKFHADLKVINDCLDDLIRRARDSRQQKDVEELQQRDYSKVNDKSLLRFLVDMRGEEPDDKQLRDDLMTMLIAGHETTAAVLTWATYMLAQNPDKIRKAQEEIDSILGGRKPTLEDLKKLQYVRLIVAESLRLYPQPPLLIRRSLKPDTLPGGYNGEASGYPIPSQTDIFISVYNLHRSPHYWNEPDKFFPERFLEAKPSEINRWAGYDPSLCPGALYPNEVNSDFAFLPFGGGPRKCVGDQFALMESTVALTLLLQKFDVELKGEPGDVELVTGATIHTKSGLWCRLKKRQSILEAPELERAFVNS